MIKRLGFMFAGLFVAVYEIYTYYPKLSIDIFLVTLSGLLMFLIGLVTIKDDIAPKMKIKILNEKFGEEIVNG